MPLRTQQLIADLIRRQHEIIITLMELETVIEEEVSERVQDQPQELDRCRTNCND